MTKHETTHCFAGAAEEERWCVGKRFGLRLHGDLLEIDVVTPDVGAVGDQPLLVGLLVHPAKAARPLDLQRAAGLLQQEPIGIDEPRTLGGIAR